jgi:hypothetical protein
MSAKPRTPKPTKKHWWELRVEPIAGEPLRFRVESVSEPEQPHTVDLELNNGGGFCDCIDFCARRDGFLKATGLPYQDRTACSHVKAAFRVFGMWAIQKVSARHQQAKASHEPPR